MMMRSRLASRLHQPDCRRIARPGSLRFWLAKVRSSLPVSILRERVGEGRVDDGDHAFAGGGGCPSGIRRSASLLGRAEAFDRIITSAKPMMALSGARTRWG